jgi:pimeloyl-ACP methyl ester carboxylesterase
MKKATIIILLFLHSFLILAQNIPNFQRPDFLKKDIIKSRIDANVQVFYYYKSSQSKPRPLVVQLHSWSNAADSLKTAFLAPESKNKDWNYIFPNFRGVNNHAKACCSEFVIGDIDEAIDWAIKNLNVDLSQIYVAGVSGGGYATLAMYMKSRHEIRGFSAWASISDLSAWYRESVERKNKYAAEILKCTDSGERIDENKARDRSPLYWKTPVKMRKNSSLQIYAGIHDGYTGSVPISQSIDFYNKLLVDAKECDTEKFISENDKTILIKTQSFPNKKSYRPLGDRAILYQKTSQKISLTIFEGTHEMLNTEVLDLLSKNNK